MTMIWTCESVATLKDGWRRGLDAPELARMLGTSRAAIRSKRMRLGLPSRTEAQIALSNRERGLAVCPRSRSSPVGMADGGRLAPLIGSAPRPWPLRDVGECAFPVAGSGALTQSCCLPVEPGEGYCRGHLVILRSGAAIGA